MFSSTNNFIFHWQTLVWALHILFPYGGVMVTSHSHATHSAGDERGFHDSKVVQNTEHINEHLQGMTALDTSNMTAEELEFHYFKLHDFDNDTRLDGLEIFKALTHLLPFEETETFEEIKKNHEGKSQYQISKERKEKELRYYVEMVDDVLDDDDLNKDGYLTYAEYVHARRLDREQD